jgi:hypothetical protein
MNTCQALLASLMLAIAPAALADSWKVKRASHTYRFRDGLRIVTANDAARTPEAPRYRLRIFHGRKLIAEYENLGFEVLAASGDEQLFVGISNYGFPGTAAVVFDRQGRILLEEWHPAGFALRAQAPLRYCGFTVTETRNWFDAESPELQFGPDGSMESITLRGCRGDRIQLVKEFVTGRRLVKEAQEKAARDEEKFFEQLFDQARKEPVERPKD